MRDHQQSSSLIQFYLLYIARSNITLLFAPLSIAMLVFHYKGYKIISALLMLLQGVLTAFMVYLRLQGYVQSDYLLYLSAVSILMLVSMTVELFIRPREKAVE